MLKSYFIIEEEYELENSQRDLLESLSQKSGLGSIQEYIAIVMKARGFSEELPQDKLMLLIEEVGELSKALRKQEGYLAIDQDLVSHYTFVQEELADVFIVLLSLCDVLKISLWDAFYQKEKQNIERRWS